MNETATAEHNPHARHLRDFLTDCQSLVGGAQPFQLSGRLTRISGLVMEAAGLKLPLGSGCRIMAPGMNPVEAEVVGFNATSCS